MLWKRIISITPINSNTPDITKVDSDLKSIAYNLSAQKEDERTASSSIVEMEKDIETLYTEEEKEDNRLPLELCFLYNEFGIIASKERVEFDFELSEEFFLDLNNINRTHDH